MTHNRNELPKRLPQKDRAAAESTPDQAARSRATRPRARPDVPEFHSFRERQFLRASGEQLRRCAEVVAVARTLATVAARRRRARAGIDRSAQDAARCPTGGVPIDLVLHKPARRPELVVLCDVS